MLTYIQVFILLVFTCRVSPTDLQQDNSFDIYHTKVSHPHGNRSYISHNPSGLLTESSHHRLKNSWNHNKSYNHSEHGHLHRLQNHINLSFNATEWIISTYIGSGHNGYLDGIGTSVNLSHPTGLAIDSLGYMYIADHNNNLIRKVTPKGETCTLAGSVKAGTSDGAGTNAKFSFPWGVAVDQRGIVYVADHNTDRIRRIGKDGNVSTFAGYHRGSVDGIGTDAKFCRPTGVAVDSEGNVYVADYQNHMIRKISPMRNVTTLAGGRVRGHSDGVGTTALFSHPKKLAVDRRGTVYVGDMDNHCIRMISPTGEVSTIGSRIPGHLDGANQTARFKFPIGITVDSHFNIFVADHNNRRIRKISAVDYFVTTIGILPEGYDDIQDYHRVYGYPVDIAVNSEGVIYFADPAPGHNRITKVMTRNITDYNVNTTSSIAFNDASSEYLN